MQDSPSPALRPSRGRAKPGRLRRTRDFTQVMRSGRRARHPLVHLAARASGLPESRVGFAVSRRVGRAVARNRVKRQLRMIMHALPLRPGFDLVVVAQPGIEACRYEEIRQAVEEGAARLSLLDGVAG